MLIAKGFLYKLRKPTPIWIEKIIIYESTSKARATPLLQYRLPVGLGPSLKTCPRWPPPSFKYNSKFRELQFSNDKPITLSPKEGKLLTLLGEKITESAINQARELLK